VRIERDNPQQLEALGQDTLITPELSSGRGLGSGGQRKEHETSFTSQSVQLKSGAGTDRQSASDTVNTRLL
jgi:hypothetical protein